MKLNNLRLLVYNFDTSFSFYKNTLGLTCTWGEPGSNYASFDIGLPSGLSLFSAELMNAAFSKNEVHTNPDAADKLVIIIEVPNVDTAYQEISSRGANFLNTPTDMAQWGIRTVHLRDPENNLIELYSEMPKEKWDAGLVAENEKYVKE
ncbi:MAG: VOC family protein [Ignavibacteria bacterium]|nr:VOC family protein [Ignavibacteria bacterium]